MKITVFTSNQPRHLHLIRSLASIADEVYAIQECNTVFPGQIKDFFNNSQTMQTYFKHVIAAEKEVFGQPCFLPNTIHQLLLKLGDLNKLSMDILEPALHSDHYIVFGSSYIKGPLIDFLIQHKAVNIHMGVSPYYRGSSCNFWAAYDGHPEMVGATIHMLSKGLDSGDMLYHALPKAEYIDPFVLGMKAVKVAHTSLVDRISNNTLFNNSQLEQDKALEYCYTKNADFTDEKAQEYLEKLLSPDEVYAKLNNRDLSLFKDPYIK